MATISLILVTAIAWYAIPALTVNGFTGRFQAPEVIAGAVGALLGLGTLLTARRRIGTGIEGLQQWIGGRFAGDGFAMWLAAGLAVRLVWGLVFLAEPFSDAATYVGLAQRIQQGGSYEVAGTRAYWPPGYPALLSLWLRLPLPTLHAILLLNLASFVVMMLAVRRLARHSLGIAGTWLALGLLAGWPTLIMLAGTASKELLLLALIPGALALLTTRSAGGPRWPATAAAGMVFGAACLVQPAVILLPVVVPIYLWLERLPLRRVAASTLLFILAAAIVIAPWTLRNLRVLGEPVLISTNGGNGFYRANNPRADGGYTERGEVDLGHLDELAADRLGYRLGKQWIREHPWDFAALLHVKQVRFLGDDSSGPYMSLKHDPRVPGWAYYAAKATCTLYWALLWAIPAAWIFAGGARRDIWNAGLVTAWLVFLYFFAIHSISESNAKYHLVTAPFLAIAFSGLLMRSNLSAAPVRSDTR